MFILESELAALLALLAEGEEKPNVVGPALLLPKVNDVSVGAPNDKLEGVVVFVDDPV